MQKSRFAQNIRDLFGSAGETWLATLPEQIARFEREWHVQVGPPFAGLSYNYVAPATRADGSACIIKACFPGETNAMLPRELLALSLYNGRGICHLLESDQDAGMLLLERLEPGTQLATLEDDAATQIAAEVIRELLRPAPPAPHPLPSAVGHASQLDNLRAAFAGGTGLFPRQLVEMAEAQFRDLLASSGPPMLIHGDLHHYNILASGAGWRAIDPQGIIAEAEYEVGALLRNPSHTLPLIINLEQRMRRRVSILADALGFDQKRIAAWGMAIAVLSAWWSYEDHGSADPLALRCAEALATIL